MHSPFLAFVADLAEFDEKFQEYVDEEYVRFKWDPATRALSVLSLMRCRYESLFGCQNMTLPETKDYYARFTQTVLCSRMVQDSKTECEMSDGNAVPVCAETCVRSTARLELALGMLTGVGPIRTFRADHRGERGDLRQFESRFSRDHKIRSCHLLGPIVG